jgi:exonuclease SbcC
MVPVQLQLQNFLSYGTEAPPLDFGRFEVACLSGRNGQGKSALLDAMTWALFGEARKSSGKRKPDDELIRIGTRHMQVAFTFDLDGTRYRVQRDFQRSATGKTTNSNLEFQLYDPDAERFNPLTRGHQRDTQARIESTLGLDYHTFINSAFLLQGRSDEFTKKSPSQRKEILGRILNLSRYERLARKAHERWKAAKRRVARAEAEVQRLSAALEEAPAWNEEKAEVEAALAEKQAALAQLREAEQGLRTRVSDLEAKAREARALAQRLDALAQRRRQHEADAAELAEKIDRAQALLAQRDTIQANYERREALQKERNALDDRREVHRGLEKQLDRLNNERDRTERDLKHRLHTLVTEVKTGEAALNEWAATLAQRPEIERKHQAARQAEAERRRLAAVRDQREAATQRLTVIEKDLHAHRASLKATLSQREERLAALADALQRLPALRQQVATLEARDAERQEAQAQMQAVEEEGKALGAAIATLEGQIETHRAAQAEVRAERAAFRAATGDAEACPTCGTPLTDAHRARVEGTFAQQLEALEAKVEAAQAAVAERETERQALRQAYRAAQARRDAHADVPSALGRARAQVQALGEQQSARADLQAEAQALRQQIEHKTYGADLRAERTRLRETLAEMPFDADHYDAVQQRAARAESLRERLNDLDAIAARREERQKKVERARAEAERLRTRLADGTALGDLPARIQHTQQQLAAVDFDAPRLADVKRELAALADAGARMTALLNAQHNRDDWQAQRAKTHERAAATRQDEAALRTKRQALLAALDDRPALESELRATRADIEAAEAACSTLQTRLGHLTARLEQAAEHRAARTAARAERKEAVRQRTLYQHLKRAFGKHGIPSLIIEETIPEIEHRANDLLDRLTDGKMHVRLETLADKKSGGTKETLDIVLTDEQGQPRPYETFSGGESFRVNFALRIALAQLLAERSGVRVRTLVIDEGFGTQDEEGIQRLVEAINVIRDDFAKVLVVTHLQRLKHVFPVRIEVAKDPATGSSFELVGA